jgi:hypothetical protein
MNSTSTVATIIQAVSPPNISQLSNPPYDMTAILHRCSKAGPAFISVSLLSLNRLLCRLAKQFVDDPFRAALRQISVNDYPHVTD